MIPSFNLLYSIILGVVQGVSEWLPISSKTQILFVSTFLFSIPVAAAFAFGLFLEIGSLGSATIYFRKDVVSVFKDRKLLIFLLVVTFFTALVGIPLYVLSERLLQKAYNFGIPMIILGAVLIFDGFYIRYSRRKPTIGGLSEMKMKHYVVVGIAQGLAALPGVSRSGMTVSTMLLMGVKPEIAFRLSYLAYIPASLGAFFATIFLSESEVQTAINAVDPTGVVVAIIIAAVVGLFVISALLKFAKKREIYIVDFALGITALSIGAIAAFYA